MGSEFVFGGTGPPGLGKAAHNVNNNVDGKVARNRTTQEGTRGQVIQSYQELFSLYDVARSMGTSLDLVDTMTQISGKLQSLVPFSYCALFLKDDDGEALRCRYTTGNDAGLIKDLRLRDEQRLISWVTQHRRPLVNRSPNTDAQVDGLNGDEKLEPGTALVYPLEFSDRIIGVLALYHTQPGFYTDAHQRRLGYLAEQLSAVVANSLMFGQAQEASLTDALTALPNARHLFLHARRELARAQRLSVSLAFMMIDLDDFKQINDHYGHHTGDRVLCKVADILRSTIRPYDICTRYAGDEFIVVLSGCTAREAKQKRDKFKRIVLKQGFETEPGTKLPLSISVGFAIFPTDGQSYESLVAVADHRMYQDKAKLKR